jgi:hypothetical protein
MGGACDRIGGALIPANDVESELLEHPGVADVALVGYPDGSGGELDCAVVVPANSPPITLDELAMYLIDQGMTDWYLPSRQEHASSLPRTTTGKSAQGPAPALADRRRRARRRVAGARGSGPRRSCWRSSADEHVRNPTTHGRSDVGRAVSRRQARAAAAGSARC